MKMFLAAVAMLALASCTSPSPGPTPTPSPIPGPIIAVGCSVEQAVTSALTASVATTLNCANLAAIQGDMMSVLGKANLCPTASAKPKGVVGNLVCPLAVDAAMGLVTNKIPVAWGCDPHATVATLSATLIAACNKVVSF